jgi:hypothetical protein
MEAYAQRLAAEARAQAAGGTEEPASAVPPQLGKHSRSDLLRAIGLEDTPSLRWRAEKGQGSSVVLLTYHEPRVGEPASALAPQLFALAERGGQLAVEARGRAQLGSDLCVENSGAGAAEGPPERKLDLDPTPYRISNGAPAIGVILNCDVSFPAGSGTERHLLLFQRQGTSFKQVLSATTERDMSDRAGGLATTETGTLSIQPSAHAGYFDLKLHLTREQGPLGGTSKKQPARDVIFEWDGSAYARR